MAETVESVATIDRDELKRKMDSGEPFVLLETLAPEEFRQSHLPGAVNAPPDRVAALASKLIPDKQTHVVTYCAGSKCLASEKAARELIALGYTNVRSYRGGKQDWTMAGLPVQRGESSAFGQEDDLIGAERFPRKADDADIV